MQNICYISDRIAYDSDTQKLFIGMTSKEFVERWIEYFCCTEMLANVSSAPSTIIQVPKIRHEIIVPNQSYQDAINFAAQLQINALNLTKRPPFIKEDITQFSRGTEVKILYSDSLKELRVGKVGVVVEVLEEIGRLGISLDSNQYIQHYYPRWLKIIGKRYLPPAVFWINSPSIGWQKETLWHNRKETNIKVGTIFWEEEAQRLKAPEDKRSCVFIGNDILEWFSNIEEAKQKAISVVDEQSIPNLGNGQTALTALTCE